VSHRKLVARCARTPHSFGHQHPTSGRAFAEADILLSKELFRQAVLQRAPLVASMYQTWRERRDGAMSADFFLDLLDERFPGEEAETSSSCMPTPNIGAFPLR
jgi:C-terminal AAA-associated domain